MKIRKRRGKTIKDELCYMLNLTPKRTGLKVIIWSEQNGESRNKSNKIPSVKITGKDYEISISLEESPRELTRSGKIEQKDEKDIQNAIDYISKNLDLFLRHFKTSPLEFDDDDLKEELRKRGYYKY